MAHGYLSYQDPRGEVDYLSMIYNRIKEYLDKREKKQRAVPDKGGALANVPKPPSDGGPIDEAKIEIVQNTPPSQHSAKQNILKGSSFAALASSGIAATSGGSGINPEVMGGGLANMGFGGKRLKPENFVGDQIIDIGATSLGVERDLGGDMFAKRLNTIDGGEGSGEIVQAIDRLTFVTMSLVSATQEQTRQQLAIAAQQEQTSERLARQAKAAAEESALERGGDFSGNTPFERLAQSAGVGGGGSGGGGGGGMFGAKALLGKAGRRGAERGLTRLGAGVGGKLAGKAGMKTGAKLGAKFGATTAGKMLGKRIPGLGLALGTGLAIQRMKEGKPIQALLEFASGAASTFPGIGTAVSLGLDGVIAGRDMGLIPFAEGGIVDKPTLGLLGENPKGRREGVFPLEGPQGRKTFRMFGEGILEAQKRNRRENSKLLAAGLSEYYDKQNGWEKFIDFLKELLPDWLRRGDPNNPGGGGGGGGGVRGGVNAANIAADTAEEKAFIATVRETEGTAGAQGYNTVYGGAVVPELTQMTLKELYDAIKLGGTDRLPERLGGGVIPFKKDQYNSSASGALQLMPETLRGMVNRGEFSWDDTFDPETQNRMILTLARNGGVDIENITPAQLDKASGIWAGLAGTYYGQTSRTAEDSFQIYKQNLKEAQKQAPTPDPADDRRQIDASQRIAQNFGRKSGQSISFVHNGEDYHAVKTTNGWDIYKGKGGIFGGTRIDTSGGKNAGVVDSFLEQAASGGGYRIPEGSEPSLEEELERLSSATSDGSTRVSAKSTEEVLLSSASGAGGGTIINNFYGTGGNNNMGNSPENILPSPGSESTGAQLYHVLQTLSA